MPISFPGSGVTGGAYGTRTIGTVVLDDGVSSFVQIEEIRKSV